MTAMVAPGRISFFGLMAAVLVGSFLVTLWLTDSPTTSSDDTPLFVTSLTRYEPRTLEQLEKAAWAVGLRRRGSLAGNLDKVERLDDRTVMIAGWAMDREGSGAPLIVIAFADGKAADPLRTKGERPDVTKSFNVREELARDVSFVARLSCALGKPLLTIAASENSYYLPLKPATCP